MSDQETGGDRIEALVEIAGDQSGQLAVGKDIDQRQAVATDPPTAAELAALDAQFRELERTVAEEAPAEERGRALERVEELESAVKADKPDLATMEYVRNWFTKHLPSVAGTVASVIVNPIVGKLVAAAGNALAAEFRRRFGGTASAS
jgi:hypothetical protein